MNKCHICKHEKECVFYDLHDLVDAINCKCFVHITNFDKVTVSPEVLAKIINEALWFKETCPFYKSCHELCDGGMMCDECITQWLKQEARDKK